ncbi:MAG: protein translocase subunit SecF [Alphaproteobacteria bacterium]
MRPLRLLDYVPNIPFMRWRFVGLAISGAITIGTLVLMLTIGLNFGIDFRGGILIEVRTQSAADLSAMRATLGGADLGEVALQEFGGPNDVLVRVARQEGGEQAQMAAVQKIRGLLGTGYEFRRVEVVGPKVGAELIEAGILATVLAIVAIAIYVWFRFELPFAIGAIVSTLHDVVATVGLFALLQLEFNTSTVAAILLIAGYSINDTVVIYDRVRENLRKYKTMPLIDLCNLSLNETLSRTLLTGGTTIAALLALFIFGGEVIRDFSGAMLFGIVIGTYSSLMVGTPLLLNFPPRRVRDEVAGKDAAGARP